MHDMLLSTPLMYATKFDREQTITKFAFCLAMRYFHVEAEYKIWQYQFKTIAARSKKTQNNTQTLRLYLAFVFTRKIPLIIIQTT